MADRKILVSLTTLSENGWKEKVEEISKNKIEEIALFLTGLNEKGRKELYLELGKTSVRSIPHVHIRTDMHPKELKFLIEYFKTKIFNIHPLSEYPLVYDYSDYASRIFLENAQNVPSDEELQRFGGLCVDFTHWENETLLGNSLYEKNIRRKAEIYPIGCGHVSAVSKELTPSVIDENKLAYDSHILKSPEELDYIKKYKKYIPDIVSLELENPISEQLEAKKYIETMIKNQEN